MSRMFYLVVIRNQDGTISKIQPTVYKTARWARKEAEGMTKYWKKPFSVLAFCTVDAVEEPKEEQAELKDIF